MAVVRVVVAVVPVSPPPGHGVAAQGDLRARHLVLQKEVPAQLAKLRVDVRNAKMPPSRPVRIVVDRAAGEGDVRDDRIAAGESERVRRVAIDRDEESPVAQGRWNQGDAVVGQAGHLGIGVVVPLVGHDIAPKRHVGVSARCREQDLPGDLFDRHLHPPGAIAIAGHGEIRRAAEGQIGHRLLPRIQIDRHPGVVRHGHEVVAVERVGGQNSGNHQHLPGLGQLIGLRMRRGGFLHIEPIGRAVQPEPPRQGLRRRGGLEEAHAFRAHRDRPAPARRIRGNRTQILNERLPGHQVPLRGRRSGHHHVPRLAHAVLGRMQHEAVRPGPVGLVSIGPRRRQGIPSHVEIGFSAGHVQRRAPCAHRRVLRGDLEVVLAAGEAAVGKHLRSEVRGSRIPVQRGQIANLRKELVGGAAGGLIYSNIVCAIRGFGIRQNQCSVGFAADLLQVGTGRRQLILANEETGHPAARRVQDQPPAGRIGGNLHAIVIPGPTGKRPHGGKGLRLSCRAGRRPKARDIGSHLHGEVVRGRRAGRAHPQMPCAGRNLRGFQVNGIFPPVEPRTEIEVLLGRSRSLFQEHMGPCARRAGDPQGEIADPRPHLEGEIGRLARRVAALTERGLLHFKVDVVEAHPAPGGHVGREKGRPHPGRARRSGHAHAAPLPCRIGQSAQRILRAARDDDAGQEIQPHSLLPRRPAVVGIEPCRKRIDPARFAGNLLPDARRVSGGRPRSPEGRAPSPFSFRMVAPVRADGAAPSHAVGVRHVPLPVLRLLRRGTGRLEPRVAQQIDLRTGPQRPRKQNDRGQAHGPSAPRPCGRPPGDPAREAGSEIIACLPAAHHRLPDEIESSRAPAAPP